jgi:hypothetical protein
VEVGAGGVRMTAARDRATTAALEAFQRGALAESDYLELLDLIGQAREPAMLDALARQLAGWPAWDPRRALRAAGSARPEATETGPPGDGPTRPPAGGRRLLDPVDLARARQAHRVRQGPLDPRLVALVAVLILVLVLVLLGVVLALVVQHGHPTALGLRPVLARRPGRGR